MQKRLTIWCKWFATLQNGQSLFSCKKEESGTEIGHSLEFDFVVPPPHN
ncbi:hypothetical protein GMC24_06535 [Streptococcus sp. BIOML-A1]|nr:hypothetical protein [Streptococcus sp. BIOML-A1]